MKGTSKITPILYFVAGALFFVAAALGKNYVFIPIGCCFIVLGAVTVNANKKNP